jgi:hypothetical protein
MSCHRTQYSDDVLQRVAEMQGRAWNGALSIVPYFSTDAGTDLFQPREGRRRISRRGSGQCWPSAGRDHAANVAIHLAPDARDCGRLPRRTRLGSRRSEPYTSPASLSSPRGSPASSRWFVLTICRKACVRHERLRGDSLPAGARRLAVRPLMWRASQASADPVGPRANLSRRKLFVDE